MLNCIEWELVKVNNKLVTTEKPFNGFLVRNKKTDEYRLYFDNLGFLSRESIGKDFIVNMIRMYA